MTDQTACYIEIYRHTEASPFSCCISLLCLQRQIRTRHVYTKKNVLYDEIIKICVSPLYTFVGEATHEYLEL